MTKASRDKGARRERELLSELQDQLGDDYPPLKRNYAQTAEGGADCIDLDGFAIEVKGCEQFRSAFFDQAKEQAGEGIPVVAWKKNRQPWRVFVELSIAEFADVVRNQR